MFIFAKAAVHRISTCPDTLDFRLVVQKLRRELTHVQDFLFKIPAQSPRMREFSSQFLDNQPEIECRHKVLQWTSGIQPCPTT